MKLNFKHVNITLKVTFFKFYIILKFVLKCPAAKLIILTSAFMFQIMASYESLSLIPGQLKDATVGKLFDINRLSLEAQSLWEFKDLSDSKLLTEQCPFTTYSVAISDTLQDRMDMMKVEASITAKLLFVSATVGADFLYEKKTSSKHTSVTAKYSTSDHTKKLKSWHTKKENMMKNINIPSSATHVISGIKYGADAFFTFEAETGTVKTKLETSGSLAKVLSAIPGLKSGSTEAEEWTRVNYKYIGDFSDPRDTEGHEKKGTFQEGLSMIQGITSSGKKHSPVPVKLFLTPLSSLYNENYIKEELAPEPDVETDYQVLDFLQNVNKVQEELNTAKFSRTSKLFINVKYAIDNVSDQFLSEYNNMHDFIKKNQSNHNLVKEKVANFKASKFGTSFSLGWIGTLLEEIDAMDALIEVTENKGIKLFANDKDVRQHQVNNTDKSTILVEVDFVSMLDSNGMNEDTCNNWLSKDNASFFSDVMHTLNQMELAGKLNTTKFLFAMKINYKTNIRESDNKTGVKLSLMETSNEKVTVATTSLHPVISRLIIENNIAVLGNDKEYNDKDVCFEFNTSPAFESPNNIHISGKTINLGDDMTGLNPGTTYHVRARLTDRTTKLIGPCSMPLKFNTEVKVKGRYIINLTLYCLRSFIFLQC